MKHILSAALTALILSTAPTPGTAQVLTSEWMTGGQFQTYIQTQINGQRLMMTHLEAGEFHGAVYYFATFDPQPSGLGWAMHHGLSDATFNARNREFQAQGYYLRHQQRFISSTGRAYNQGVWYRN
ncbi:hypothetical protein [Jannaschia sp. CCS1]|uniref:hypothetical protein n=1 Tax=Jannaschia sp. (strain CCS1) TaxID=290400 RepID=UPI000053D560|nr:hypothetical protein [Jannaschia sp. CCS1]ABD55265.1 hypothetical protein Jann_2348 [Jannaschia sp. CCS1]